RARASSRRRQRQARPRRTRGRRVVRSRGAAPGRARHAQEPGQEHAFPRLRACRPRALNDRGRKCGLRTMRKTVSVLSLVFMAACGSAPNKGGYYKDDGPHERPPANLDRIADAVPRSEPLHKYANRPYEAMGKKYVPMTTVQPFRQQGLASWYGKRYHGQKTSSGETYDMYAMTAAHPTLPIPSYARVTNVAN